MYCRREAQALLEAQLADLETPRGLVYGAVAVALHELRGVDPAAVDRLLQEIADDVRARVPSGQPKALLAHAHEHLFDRLGFQGNEAEYYDPQNSYLPVVLATRRGLPITLSLVYADVLRRLGFTVEGVNAPGHFLARIHCEGDTLLVDAFHRGRVLSENEALERIAQNLGGGTPRSSTLLAAATHRQWLKRMIRNLQLVFEREGRDRDLGAMQELEEVLR